MIVSVHVQDNGPRGSRRRGSTDPIPIANFPVTIYVDRSLENSELKETDFRNPLSYTD